MIRVAISDRNRADRIRLRDTIERYLREANITNFDIRTFPSAESLGQAIKRRRPGIFSVAAFRLDESAEDDSDKPAVLDIVESVREDSPNLPIVLTSKRGEYAKYAYELDAQFLPLDSSYEDAIAVIGAWLSQRLRDKRALFVAVKSKKGIENVSLADIQFVESSKRGPVIHLPEGRSVTAHGTLQTLYENIVSAGQGDSDTEGESDVAGTFAVPLSRCFIKAGSSFIVNLDNVRSVGEGSLIFADGEAIVIPIRKRKAVKDALQSYLMR